MLYHTDTSGPDHDAFKRAFAKAFALAKPPGPGDLVLATHAISNLKGVIEAVLGERFAKYLAKARTVDLHGVRVHLETERIRSSCARAVILARPVSPRLLSTARSDPRMVALVYVPWAPQERDR